MPGSDDPQLPTRAARVVAVTPALEHALVELVRLRLPALFLIVDSRFHVLEANHHTRALLGEKVVGSDLRTFLTNFQSQLSPEELLSWVNASRQLHFQTFTGLVQSVECKLFAHREGFVLIGGVDQREQELLRAELLSSNRELSNRRRELQKALNELAHLNELKDRFLAMAAHDLRHPIQTVRLISEMALIESERPMEECLQDFQEICEANRLMGQVVDSFLSLAVLQSGSLRLDLESTCLAQLVEETFRLVKHAAARKEITLRCQVLRDPGRLSLDSAKVKQVLLNLVTNAIEHGPAGQEVLVRLDYQEDQVSLQVIDQGSGISPELQTNLFEAFVCGPSGKTAGERSSGLGLYIANLLVDAHGGKLSITSQPGQGSIFTIILPQAA